eukprot:CAMPEP_0183603858 /NCGR_PEP_ID=MMETSP0371-20130417/181659_1 /TAXON_ID=268820 /ORGANISM="Peridinium aciculiferum, Strain PAER-2" /LENGTH=247 /DNA_ID=CAMNT_0025815955 /DNA_START=1993 /DNA_END=2736 /DNA_ORIENTATION=-
MSSMVIALLPVHSDPLALHLLAADVLELLLLKVVVRTLGPSSPASPLASCRSLAKVSHRPVLVLPLLISAMVVPSTSLTYGQTSMLIALLPVHSGLLALHLLAANILELLLLKVVVHTPGPSSPTSPLASHQSLAKVSPRLVLVLPLLISAMVVPTTSLTYGQTPSAPVRSSPAPLHGHLRRRPATIVAFAHLELPSRAVPRRWPTRCPLPTAEADQTSVVRCSAHFAPKPTVAGHADAVLIANGRG